MTQELKPCPFCGGGVEYFELSWTATTFGGHMYASPFWQIRCKDCRVTLGDFDTKAEAIDAWNTRAERTCKMETDHDELEVIAYSHEDTWAYKCNACGWSFRYDRGIKPNYCPNCGAMVES